MKCENCPLLIVENCSLLIVENCGKATAYPDKYCGFEGEYTPNVDGSEGCHIPWIKVQKILRLRGDV